jgi:hypothetical protein
MTGVSIVSVVVLPRRAAHLSAGVRLLVLCLAGLAAAAIAAIRLHRHRHRREHRAGHRLPHWL